MLKSRIPVRPRRSVPRIAMTVMVAPIYRPRTRNASRRDVGESKGIIDLTFAPRATTECTVAGRGVSGGDGIWRGCGLGRLHTGDNRSSGSDAGNGGTGASCIERPRVHDGILGFRRRAAHSSPSLRLKRRIFRYRVRRSIPKMEAARIWCPLVRRRIMAI